MYLLSQEAKKDLAVLPVFARSGFISIGKKSNLFPLFAVFPEPTLALAFRSPAGHFFARSFSDKRDTGYMEKQDANQALIGFKAGRK